MSSITIFISTNSDPVPVDLARRVYDALAAAPELQGHLHIRFDNPAAAQAFKANVATQAPETRPVEIIVTDTAGLLTIHH